MVATNYSSSTASWRSRLDLDGGLYRTQAPMRRLSQFGEGEGWAAAARKSRPRRRVAHQSTAPWVPSLDAAGASWRSKRTSERAVLRNRRRPPATPEHNPAPKLPAIRVPRHEAVVVRDDDSPYSSPSLLEAPLTSPLGSPEPLDLHPQKRKASEREAAATAKKAKEDIHPQRRKATSSSSLLESCDTEEAVARKAVEEEEVSLPEQQSQHPPPRAIASMLERRAMVGSARVLQAAVKGWGLRRALRMDRISRAESARARWACQPRPPTPSACTLRDTSTQLPVYSEPAPKYSATGQPVSRPSPVGKRVWPVARFLTRLMLEKPDLIRGKSVLELGAGPGLCGGAAATCGAEVVVMSDVDPQVLSLLTKNVWEWSKSSCADLSETIVLR